MFLFGETPTERKYKYIWAGDQHCINNSNVQKSFPLVFQTMYRYTVITASEVFLMFTTQLYHILVLFFY